MVGIGKKIAGEPDIEEGDSPVIVGEMAHEGSERPPVLAAAYGTLAERGARTVGGLLSRPRVQGKVIDLLKIDSQLARAPPHALIRRAVERRGARIQVEAGVLLVRRATVVALHVVLHGELPVGAHRVGLAVRHLRLRPAVQARGSRESRLHVLEAERRIGEGHEDQPFDDPRMNALEPVGCAIEVIRHVTRRAQPAVEPVAPGVIRAHETPAMGVPGFLRAHARAAMAADIQQRAHLAVLPANQE